MRKITLLLLVCFSLISCVQEPYKAYQGPELAESEIAVLPIRGDNFEVVSINGKSVDHWYKGSLAWSLIHLKPGTYHIELNAKGVTESGITGYTRVNLTAIFHKGKSYFIKSKMQAGNNIYFWIEDESGNIVTRFY